MEMGYRLPSDEEIISAIILCMVENSTVHSQHELGELVRKIIAREGSPTLVSDRRIRRIAVSNRLVRLELHYRNSGRAAGDACVVCGGKMKKKRNRTVEGKTITIGYRCPSCGYSTGTKAELPARYVFHAGKNIHIARSGMWSDTFG